MQQATKDGESMHQQPSLMRAVSRVGALVVMASALTILGCDGGGDDEFRDATPADLENRAFTFVVEGEPATFTFGSFDADGDSDAATGIFTARPKEPVLRQPYPLTTRLRSHAGSVLMTLSITATNRSIPMSNG